MEPKFKIGDLVVLNDFGRLVTDNNRNRVCLIISGPITNYYSIRDTIDEEPFCFFAYNIMIGDELITDIPQEFLERMIESKKSTGEE